MELSDNLEMCPFITICMPVYNAMWSLERVLGSITKIDYPKNLLRLVFVDNGSTDGTWEYLYEFKRKYECEYESVVLARTPKKGLGHVRNVCLKYVKGWLFWVESDLIFPSQILKHLLVHFGRNPKVGWARCPWTRDIPTSFYERVLLSTVPKTYRCVDVTEHSCSLIRPEAMQVFGLFYEDGGIPYDSWEASEQFVKLRKAGWNIVVDGTITRQCIHLVRPDGSPWGQIIEPAGSKVRTIIVAIERILKMSWYYLVEFPKRPLHDWIKAGNLKYALKVTYYFAAPYLLVYAIISLKFLLLLYIAPALAYYAVEVRSWQMKIVVPFILVLRWALIAQGYIFLLFKRLINKLARLLRL